MANKRMFNNSVIQTDDFLRLPHSAIPVRLAANTESIVFVRMRKR